MSALSAGFAEFSKWILRQLTSAQLWFLLLGISGASSLIVGVFMLAGAPWALIAGGIVGVGTALMILIGMTRGA